MMMGQNIYRQIRIKQQVYGSKTVCEHTCMSMGMQATRCAYVCVIMSQLVEGMGSE